MDNYLDLMRARREQILERFYAALDRAGRPHDAASLIAVSKTVGVDETVAAIQAGYRHFAENRPQELVRKLTGLAEHPELPEVRFDMIGNLQTNKINAVLGSAELIHSVGSLHLAQAISSRAVRKIEAGELAGPQRVLIEVNVSGEESKGGFSPDGIRAAAGELAELEGICVQGLMTMAPRGNKDVARRTFAGLRELRDELEAAHPDLNLPELSCGMSEDFESALEEGSTLVRLGRVVFSLDEIKNKMHLGGQQGYDQGYGQDDDYGYDDGYDDGYQGNGYSGASGEGFYTQDEPSNGLLGQTRRGEAESVAVYTRSGQLVGDDSRHATTYNPPSRSQDSVASGYRPGAYDTPSSYAENTRARAAAAPAPAPSDASAYASNIINATPQLPAYVLRPESYDDVETVVRRVRTKQPVALIFVGVRTEVAKRVLDFSYGFACGLGATVKEVGDRVFMVLPAGCEVKDSDLKKLRADGYLK